MARTTPGTGIPVPESADPRTITTDLWAMGSRISSLISQTSGESSTALTRAQAAEATSAAAMARAAKVQYPIEAGVTAPADPEKLWVDEGDNPSGPGVSWGELTGKPDAFPPSPHSHDDRYYTEAEVDQKITSAINSRLADLEYQSGERRITGLIPNVTSGDLYVFRFGRSVWMDFRDLICSDSSGSFHSWAGLLPSGFRAIRSFHYLPLTALSTVNTPGPVRISATGDVVVYNTAGQKRMTGLIGFPTKDPVPVTLPGTAA